MNFKNKIGILAFIIIFASCKKEWDDHYNSPDATSNENVWDAVQKNPELSSFVNYMKQFQYDTLFLTNNTYTLFAPTNDAFAQFTASGDSITEGLMAYLLSKYYIQTASIDGKRKIQTFSKKFALFDYRPEGSYLDDIPLKFESPAYKNGKFFVIDSVAKPKPNLYEYIALTNPVLKAFIDSQDSIILDKNLSTPIGFDENGNTIYDSVVEIINMFELEFFEVSKEFRNRTATIVFPKQENYEAALTAMAQEMNAGYNSFEDIPMEWQNEILIPYLLEHGVFENMLEREEFIRKTVKDTVKLKNILGDSVVIDYEPGEKTIASNGYAYNYDDFSVPDTLYKAAVRFEAEWLLRTVGQSYVWYPFAKNTSTVAFAPTKNRIPTHSNDTVMFVSFTEGYTGNWTLEFNVDNLFPRRYLAVCHISPVYGGIYDIYVNNQLVRTFNYGTEISDRKIVNSVIPNKRYYPKDQWTKFDFWIDNLEVYGNAVIKFVYRGPVPYREGLSLDYIDFVPY